MANIPDFFSVESDDENTEVFAAESQALNPGVDRRGSLFVTDLSDELSLSRAQNAELSKKMKSSNSNVPLMRA